MPIDLQNTIASREAIRLLTDLQGNILVKHGRPFAIHLFFKFEEQNIDEAKRWIEKFARQNLRSTSEQLLEPERRDAESRAAPAERGLFVNLFLSAAGYAALGLNPPQERAFVGGMKAANLNDPDVSLWEEPYQREIHGMVLWAHDEPERLAEAEEEFREGVRGAEILTVERGAELDGGIEHFGFVDGISQPLFIREEIEEARKQTTRQLLWDPATNLQMILSPDPHGLEKNSYGSFFVFRKLAQAVSKFNSNVRRVAETLGVGDDLAGAFMVGRFKDGTPVALSHAPGLGVVNDFNYTDDASGLKCPFHSHIRKVNPRGELDDLAEGPDTRNRIARRGISYGKIGDEKVGLLFMCFQSNINKQFELIQINWANFPHFPRVRVGVDPLIGQPNTWDSIKEQQWPKIWGEDELESCRLEQCVTLEGGEYFFAPSLSFLRNLSTIESETRKRE